MRRAAEGFPDILAEHRRWWLFLAGVLTLAIVIFLVINIIMPDVQVRRVQYVYGLFAAVGMFLVMGYGVRRRLPEVNAGHLRFWMQMHVYVSVITFVLFAIHSGFRAGGIVSFTLAVCFYATLATGIIGYALFQTGPKMVTAVERYENLYADFPHINRRILDEGDTTVEKGSAELKQFYQRAVRPTLLMRGPQGRHYLRVGTVDKAVEEMMFEHIKRLLTEEDLARLNRVKDLLDQKNEVLFQMAAQKVLRGWLVFHVPAAIGTMVLLTYHIGCMLYYYGAP